MFHPFDEVCDGLFQVKDLVELIEAAEVTILTQVLAATALVYLDRNFESFYGVECGLAQLF